METRLLAQLIAYLSGKSLEWPALLVIVFVAVGILYCKTLDKLPAILHEIPPVIQALNRSSQVGAVGEKRVRNQVSPRPPVGN
jgi:hypothetical protein